MKKFLIRKVAALALAISFILLSITGLQLTLGHKPEVVKSPMVAQSQENKMNYEKPFYPKELHEWAGYVFIVAGSVHFMLNIKPLRSYLKIKS